MTAPSSSVSSSLVEALRRALDSAGPPGGRNGFRGAVPGAPAPGAPLDASFAERHPRAVLVVEDNALGRKMALALLARLGYAADTATNGLEALQAVRRRHYDLVLMDVEMPVLDGIAAARQIRDAPAANQRPRIVALTAAEGDADRERCRVAGMEAHLVKPLRLEALAAALAGLPEPTIDLAAVAARVEAHGEAALMADLRAFLTAVSERLPSLTSALADADWDRATRDARELDRRAMQAGVTRAGAVLGELLDAHTAAALASDPTRLEDRLSRVRDALGEGRRVIAEVLGA